MSLTIPQVRALRALYTQVVFINDTSAYDEQGDEVIYDLDAVNTRVETDEQAAVDARQSAINKLMALGLTEEEALALGVK